jgi:hypothetical protein
MRSFSCTRNGRSPNRNERLSSYATSTVTAPGPPSVRPSTASASAVPSVRTLASRRSSTSSQGTPSSGFPTTRYAGFAREPCQPSPSGESSWRQSRRSTWLATSFPLPRRPRPAAHRPLRFRRGSVVCRKLHLLRPRWCSPERAKRHPSSFCGDTEDQQDRWLLRHSPPPGHLPGLPTAPPLHRQGC